MSTFRIQGGRPLTGTLAIAGRKNSALPLIAATVLNRGTTTLTNLPEIDDVAVMLDILEKLGATVKKGEHQVTINTANLTPANAVIPEEDGRRLRGSLLFLGPLLARFGRARLPHPGGCIIGKRPVGVHFDAVEAMGATITTEGDWYEVTANELHATTFFMTEASVTGTENALMAAAGGTEPITLVNVAREDHVIQLGQFLEQLGCRLDGLGTSSITVHGLGRALPQKDLTIEIIPDEIELGTFMVAAAVTSGELELTNLGDEHLTLPIRSLMKSLGVNFEDYPVQSRLVIKPPHSFKPGTIKTGIWPGTPTDLQSPLALLATQTTGNTLIHDWMFEGRFSYVSGLSKMGADILICDPHRILVHGPTPLKGTKLVSPDLRAGMAQLIAGLVASGESIIEHGEVIERGYERLVERLSSLGAIIEEVS
jgi:UDP-N-acetylglucosamine 1-carboxyvinyltransferase